MDLKKTQAPISTVTYDRNEVDAQTDNIYEAIAIASKRAIQINEEIKRELLDKLEEAGFELREPGCSACLAMNDDKIPAGKYAVSTSNRNFEGRQGPGSRTLLASPTVAAAAAVMGVVTDPRSLV